MSNSTTKKICKNFLESLDKESSSSIMGVQKETKMHRLQDYNEHGESDGIIENMLLMWGEGDVREHLRQGDKNRGHLVDDELLEAVYEDINSDLHLSAHIRQVLGEAIDRYIEENLDE